MDTKWNSTDRPVPAGDVPLKEGRPRGGRMKALAGFLAFVLGVSLTVSSLGSAGGRLLWERDPFPLYARDWQETENFRMEIASILKDFLTLGAGGRLDAYGYDYWIESDIAYEAAIVQSTEGGWWWDASSRLQEALPIDRGTASSESVPAAPAEERAPDADYQNDKNVLYLIQSVKDGKLSTDYSNGGSPAQFADRQLEGYNFYLTFQDGKVSIFKDGEELDVYGDGFYNEDSQWFVPGYENFPATKQLDGVKVVMAVRETPIRYHSVDYKTGASYNSSSMYYIAQWVEESQAFYRTQAILLGAGLACLALWLLLRKATEPVDRKIASWTVHVWTEIRFLLVLCLLAGLVLTFTDYGAFGEVFYSLRWDYGMTLSDLGSALLRLILGSVPALLVLIWSIWLIRNDHRYNPKEARRSLLRPFLRGLRARDLKRSVEKRLSRRTALMILAVFLLSAEVLSVLIDLTVAGSFPAWLIWTVCLLPVLLAAGAVSLFQRCQGDLARDLGRLADQVEAVRAGDLSRPLVLPEDTDLRQTADSLNDIQAGMKAALEEQTRSERMKVELVSNVSHDLKTPLTSILSYAELLRQEDLPPAAMDYARIVDEKAHRLKSMVEDVFEISKAAADQLPVHLERLDLSKLLRQTLADMDGPIRDSALTFKIDLPEEPVTITADGRRLYRVFQNLIDNALRYALEGSRVYLSLKTAEGTAEASVRNTSRTELPEGVDFTARFVRGDASRTDGGSGLGLSIASSFTQACGGTFRVETVADLFTAIVTFPIERER